MLNTHKIPLLIEKKLAVSSSACRVRISHNILVWQHYNVLYWVSWYQKVQKA